MLQAEAQDFGCICARVTLITALPRGARDTALRCPLANPLNLNRLEPAEGKVQVLSILALSPHWRMI